MPTHQEINLGEAIRGARERSGLSLTEMARRAEYTLQHMSRIENGHSEVTAELMAKVAEVVEEPRLLVVYWDTRVGVLADELKKAREALKEARARATATAR